VYVGAHVEGSTRAGRVSAGQDEDVLVTPTKIIQTRSLARECTPGKCGASEIRFAREGGRERTPASRERRVGAIELIFIKFARDTKFRFDGKIYLRASARNIPVTFSPARTERAEMKSRIPLLNPETSILTRQARNCIMKYTKTADGVLSLSRLVASRPPSYAVKIKTDYRKFIFIGNV